MIYSNSLEATHAEIEKADGQIIKPIFVFPDGRRFHFTLGIWARGFAQ